MEPSIDLVCILLETPFYKWKDSDKKDLLINSDRPQPALNCVTIGTARTRNFQNAWYSKHQWLCGSRFYQKLFCWPCLLMGVRKNVWNEVGFNNMANANRSFQKHESCSEHIKNAVSFKDLKKNFNRIADALQENSRLCIANFNKNVKLNRDFMYIPINTVLFLAKQELGFRGHDESVTSQNRGNFKVLLKLLIDTSSLEIKQQYEKIKNVFMGDSKIIQNELIECIYNHILDEILKEIKNSSFFSIIVDDTTDITVATQCSIVLRFVDKNGLVVERFLGFHDVTCDRTASGLFNLVDNRLNELNLEHRKKLIAQCYDGASVMSGHLNGLQMKMKDIAPQAVFVHCLAHRLNLVLKQSLSSISDCRIFFASLGGIPTFFHVSSKRTYVAEAVVKKRIPTAVETRWSSHFKTLKVVVNEWHGLKEVFEKLMGDPLSDEKTIRQAEGFLNKLNDFKFNFLSKVLRDIFEQGDILFNILQKQSLDINFCLKSIENTKKLIQNLRNDEEFSKYFENSKINTELKLKRNETETQVSLNYKMLYFEIIDSIVMEIDSRFQDCQKIQFISLGDHKKFNEFSKKFPIDLVENLKGTYGIYFDMNRLKNELQYIYSDPRFNDMCLENILKFMTENDMKDVFQEVFKLFSLILTIPSTSCSAERSFSALKRIKTFLRNTVSQERLNGLATISIEKSLVNNLIENTPFHEDIIDRFAALKNRRIDLIFKN